MLDRLTTNTWRSCVAFNGLVMPAVLVFASWWFAVPPLARFPVSVIGILPWAAGLFLGISAFRAFRREGVSIDLTKQPKKLVKEFPFNRVRNPVYLSVLLSLLGMGLVFEAFLLFAWMVWMFCFFHFLALPWEENKLNERFGREWLQYKKRVPRWLPRLY